MPDKKNYSAAVGVDKMYYALITTDSPIETGEIEDVDFVQTIGVEMPQEVQRAYGSDKTAEVAVSSGDVNVTGAFHKLPLEDRQRLLGLETVEGLTSYGSEDNPPYVAVIFAKNNADGSKEWVGLTKGMFTRPNINAQTKEGSTTFQNDEISGAFMDRKVEGFSKDKIVISGFDKKGETTKRDALFQSVFGKPFPGSSTGGGVEG
ncbi:phage tail protein [Alkalihalophilus marmarensis]|jgi:phi13 family phage major tail protein|uniref:major tail protein n=1 Tax=Alkalihalophilus marmarensis TaxID=521377 RepID=UPI00203E557F|nr:major tail protein [Alkalihalophilus marmarensis]MCM3487896.1 phage tail protein [Alkalihalophilus marmarensis]